MANRRFNRSFRSNAPRRQTEWLAREFVSGFTNIAASSKNLDSVMDTTEKAKLPFTVTRTIGLLTVWSDQVIAFETVNGAVGMAVVTDRATTTGITALPDPVTEANADFWWLYMPFIALGSAAADSSNQHVFQMKIDSRAQRKVEEGQDLAIIVANASTTGLSYILDYRILIKLH